MPSILKGYESLNRNRVSALLLRAIILKSKGQIFIPW